MAKKRSMPLEILEHFKNKNDKNASKNDDEKRKAALDKARTRLDKKNKKEEK
jgi:hypothetical protein